MSSTAVSYLLLILLLLLCGVRLSADAVPDDSLYVVLLDAGSSGTRVHVHPYLLGDSNASPSSSSVSLPVIHPSFSMKVKPGLSQFSSPSSAANSLEPLLLFAMSHVPEQLHNVTAVYLYATAGLRTIPLHEAEMILTECRLLLSRFPFVFDDDSVRIISGVQEGINGWIATNYLLGHFQERQTTDSNSSGTVGVLEMGGASFQLTFAPSDPSLFPSHTLIPLHIADHSYLIYTVSYLNYGLEKAQELYANKYRHVFHQQGDPCYPVGLQKHAVSNGEYDKCVQLIDQLIRHEVVEEIITQQQQQQQQEPQEKQAEDQLTQEQQWEQQQPSLSSSASSSSSSTDNDSDVTLHDSAHHESGHIVDCAVQSCSFSGHFIPPIQAHEQFIAIENFFYTSEFFDLLSSHTLDMVGMKNKGKQYCQMHWEEIERTWPTEPKGDLEKYCFSAAYLPRVLEVGLGMGMGTQHKQSNTAAAATTANDEHIVSVTEEVTGWNAGELSVAVELNVRDTIVTDAAHHSPLIAETEIISTTTTTSNSKVDSQPTGGNDTTSVLHNVRITKHINGVAIDWALGAVLLEITHRLHRDRYHRDNKQR